MLRSISICVACCLSAFGADFDASTAQWDWIDMTGDAQIHTVEALNPPPGYGPEVLELRGDLILGLLKDERLDTGDILVLYRELEARDKDADGIILFHADYGDSVSVEHNTKVMRPQSWLELDNDSGVHFRAIGEDGEERAFDEHPGLMLVTDDWNITGWIWQRVHITEDRVMGRVWPAHEAEPVDWHLDTERFSGDGRRFGLRVSSGAVQVAHFEAGEEIASPPLSEEPWIYFPKSDLVSPDHIALYIFSTKAITDKELPVTLKWGSQKTNASLLKDNPHPAESTCYPYYLRTHVPPFNADGVKPEGRVALQFQDSVGEFNIVYDDVLANELGALFARHFSSELIVTDSLEMRIHVNAQFHLAQAGLAALSKGDQEGARLRLADVKEARAYEDELRKNKGRPGDFTLFKNRWASTNDAHDFETHLVYGFSGYQWAELVHPNGERVRWYPTPNSRNRHHEFVITPTMGYYTLRWELDGEVHEQKIVGPVVETKDGQLYVNGEPFIVKGVNVHALDSGNPERTRRMMKSLKGLGFNMLRGDYPPTWEVEMGEEENLFWTILAPFSVASTDEIQERQGGSLMGEAREIAMEHILKYRDYAGTLLWNSCNEITGDTTAFLENLYPVYKHLDPYRRPVHYANLFGQERWQGQDAVGINYYFAKGQTPEDKHPLIQKSIDLAKAQNKPVFYTEYNSYQGPDPQGGVMAIEGLFEWGVEQGMSGGFLYMAPTSSDHPGVWVDGELNTDSRMAAAFHKAFDDVEIRLDQSGDSSKLVITNKRPYTLRNISIKLEDARKDLFIQTLGPNKSHDISALFSPGLIEPSLIVQMESHYGIRSTITSPIILISNQ